MDIFFYDETSNPYTGYGVDLEKLKTYNKYICKHSVNHVANFVN